MLKGFLLKDILNILLSPPPSHQKRQEGLPAAAPVAELDAASAEVKHSPSSLSRASSMCCQCVGKNDFKLLSSQSLVRASQPHSDKPVTT